MIESAVLPALREEAVEAYLRNLFGPSLRLSGIQPMGRPSGTKGFGYGVPVRIDYEVAGVPLSAVLETVAPGAFGHEEMSDRAQAALGAHSTYNRLPRHVRSLDAGAFLPASQMLSVGRAKEFFVLTEFAEGAPYALDLERIAETGRAGPLDFERADALCDYLVLIHSKRGGQRSLWDRRFRELVGHGECIMGLTDSYPASHEWITRARLEALEHRAVGWRWRLKDRAHRLCAVHGDFHPWNLLFREGVDFTALDRSRGEWGEAADDVTCLTLNYLFFSLRRSGKFEGDLARLFARFWERYLRTTADPGILELAAPFFAFRGLVMASPVWYPDLDDSVRRSLFRFIERVLELPRFDPGAVEGLLR